MAYRGNWELKDVQNGTNWIRIKKKHDCLFK